MSGPVIHNVEIDWDLDLSGTNKSSQNSMSTQAKNVVTSFQ